METVGYKRFVKRFCLISLMGTLGLFAQSPRFSFSTDSVSVSILATLKPDTTLKVFHGAWEPNTPQKPILGKTTIAKERLSFYPWVPLQRETVYTAVWEGQAQTFSISKEKEYVALQIEGIHPATDTVPSNLLKWYIKFSRPVNPSKIYEHISLVDASGNVVKRAVLPLETPLLSEDGRTLTLWMEPGRQKRDLGPNARLGEVMQPQKAYSLRVSPQLKDKNGLFLENAYQHNFKTGGPDRELPKIPQWELQLPISGKKDELRIEFGETLDYGSLHNSFSILTSNGKPVEGNFQYKDRSVSFYPTVPWSAETYVLHYKKRIEDLAGNNLERPFDRDVDIPLEKPILKRTFTITH